GSHLHGRSLGSGHGAPQQQQVLLREDLHDGQPALGHASAAHAPWTPDPLEHARRCRRRADRSRRADVVGAVGFGPAGKVVALDRALKPLALRLTGDLDVLADFERLHRDRLADQQLAGLVAELHYVAVGGRVSLLQVTELGPGQRLLLAGAERELHGFVAIVLDGANRGHRARPRLEHRHALDATVVEKPLGHPELLGENGGHRRQEARRISISTPAGRRSSRWSESTVLGVGWWMSISRLCVRISKGSRESLSLNGERIPQE